VIAVLLVAFVVLLLASVPIAIAMGAASLVAVLIVGQIPPIVIVQRMYSGVDSFVLLAVPLFILAGSLMEAGGISARLVQLARVLVGHVRGGLGMVVMVAEYLFSGLSGSVAADVSAIGSLLVPAMVKAGYSKPDSVCIVSAASAMGILVPPCIQMIVIASITGSSIAALFMAGFLPAMVMAALLMALVYALARMNDWPADAKATLGQIVRAALGALIPLGMPIIIFGCIFLGVTTPTEAGALAVVYALVVGRFVYGELQWKDLPGIFARCAITTAAVSLLIATSSAFAWLMAMQYVPNMLLDWFHAISDSPTVFMLLSAAAFILLGAVLEGIPALLILMPTLAPSVKAFGISQLHFDILAVAGTGIGLFLPPIGIGVLIAVAFTNVDLTQVMRAFAPYLVVLCIGMLVIVFFPGLVLWLPQHTGFIK
jgi:C4-dicarboxylate transporter DctM subunit